MSLITVSLSAAILCFSNLCHPALVGKDTPTGKFQIIDRYTETPGYGGEVLQFTEINGVVLAIHRVWLLKPSEHRQDKLDHGSAADRRYVSKGCINVTPEVFDEIKNATKVEILP
jgi:hypothetical protein